MTHSRALLLLTVPLVAAACRSTTDPGDGDPATGSIQVTVSTGGTALDPDGYSASVGSAQQAVAIDGSVTFTGVPVGSQSVSLGGIEANCDPSESNPQSVTVTAGQTAMVDFTVTCLRLTEAMLLVASDREGSLYVLDESTGAASRFYVPAATGVNGGEALGVISSIAWLWSADSLWFGLGGTSICSGCLYDQQPWWALATQVSDISATVRAPAGLAVHPITGVLYTTEGDGNSGLYVVNYPAGDLQTPIPLAEEPSSGKGMTFTRDGSALLIGGFQEMVSVDLSTGTATALGIPTLNGFPGGVTQSRVRSMATNDDDGTIYAITRSGRTDPAELATVDPATGALTWVATIDLELDGLSYVPSRKVDQLTAETGRRVVFVSDEPGNNEIFTMDPFGGRLTRITNDPADDDDPSLSPDRSTVVFASDRDGDWEIYTVPTDGSAPPTPLTSTAEGEWDPVYSSDGTRIVFLRTVLASSDQNLYSMAADGSDVIQLTNDPAQEVNPDWSPDGLNIVYQGNADGDWEIYTSSGTSIGAPIQLTNNQGVNVDPAWSPDGTRILFASNRTGQYEIWIMDADGSNQVQLTTAGGQEPAWSPAENQIVFSRQRAGNGSGDWEVFVMNIDGTGIRPISNFAGDDDEAEWR